MPPSAAGAVASGGAAAAIALQNIEAAIGDKNRMLRGYYDT